MFDSEYFSKLLNETISYIQNRDLHSDVEDLDTRIESNKLALRILTEDIQDRDLKDEVLNRLDNLYQETSTVIYRDIIKDNENEDIEEDIYKSSKILKDKASRLYKDLIFDQAVLDRVSNKINKNITDTSENIKKIQGRKEGGGLSQIIYVIIIFLIIYFIIRFL
ncbi:uncharacterized protein VNE69_12015 [Vairimorpha necatrix]|uniref:Membrane protein n=1 Tax=Vairimorpha necatrix TaxID=6039 RepID=A0AAX4JGE5_9MICR